MASILVDDTRDPSTASYETFMTDLESIAKFKITRNSSYKWAQNLRYLTYDEDESEEVLRIDMGGKGKERADEFLEEQNNDQCSVKVQRDARSADGSVVATSPSDKIQGSSSMNAAVHVSIASSTAAQAAGNCEIGARTTPPASVGSNGQASDDNFYDSDDEEAMLDYAIAMSLAEDGDNQDIVSLSETDRTRADSNQEKSNNTLDRSADRSCDLCLSQPLFPSNGKCTKFKVIQFGMPEVSHKRPCEHYLAVSYCWPKDKEGNVLPVKSTYTVKEIDQNGIEFERPSRAPDEVIDRAVGVARSQGIRLIWIDQECLPQDDSDEQATGIQAMDMVYQQAVKSVGLIANVVITQSQLDAIASVLEWRVSGRMHVHWPAPVVTFDMVCRELMTFLKNFKTDQFHTRAWILQEMFSAGRHAMLVLKSEKGAYWRAPSHLLEAPQFGIPDVFNILVEDAQLLITAARHFLLQTFRLSAGGGIAAFTNSSNSFVSESIQLLEELELFHPHHVQATHFSSFVHVRGGAAYGPRKVCNAATALTFLSTRLNSLPRDRLAIMANLCDYEVRLDLRKIDRHCNSLRTCLFALAILNGDLSLLIPDVYKSKAVQGLSLPSWSTNIHKIMQSVKTTSLKPGLSISLRSAHRYRLEDGSFTLPGYLWTVDRFIDMMPIQLKHKERWDRWKCYKLEVGHKQGESEKEFQQRIAQVQEAIQDKGIIPEDLKKDLDIHELPWEEFQDTNRHSNDSQSNPSDNPVSIAVTRFISAQRIDNDPSVRFMIGYIIWEILVMLHGYMGESAVANSIWHSLRTDALVKSSTDGLQEPDSKMDLPDDVATLLKDQWGNLSQRMWDVLKLDRSETGTFYQIWLIERIMRDGGFWVGKYNRAVIPWNGNAEREAQVEAEAKARAEKSDVRWKSKIMQAQLTKQMLASMVQVQRGDPVGDGDTFNGVNLGAMASFTYTLTSNSWTEKAEDERAKRVSVFDVDGPCEIFTPYDADMERLPRPEYRSMQACWVVEKVNGGDDEEKMTTDSSLLTEHLLNPHSSASQTEDEQHHTQGGDYVVMESEGRDDVAQTKDVHSSASEDIATAAKGATDPSPSILVADDRCSGATAEESSPSLAALSIQTESKANPDQRDEVGIPSNTKTEAGPEIPSKPAKYRVVGRVRGAWECMEEPIQAYSFV